MAPHITAIEAYVGNRPRVIASGPISTTVATESTVVTFVGELSERRALVMELARALDLHDLHFVDPDATPAKILEMPRR